MKKIFSAVALFLALVCVPTIHGQALFRLQNVASGGGGGATFTFGGASSAAFGTSTAPAGAAQTPTASSSALISGYFFSKTVVNTFSSNNSTIRQTTSDTFHGEGLGVGDQFVASASGSYTASATLGTSVPWTAFTTWYKRSTGTWTFIGGSSSGTAGACVGPTTCSVSYTPANTHLVIADIMCNNTTSAQNPTITTDNGTSTWANAFLLASDSGNFYEQEDYTLAVAGSPTTITAHCGAATTSILVTVREYN